MSDSVPAQAPLTRQSQDALMSDIEILGGQLLGAQNAAHEALAEVESLRSLLAVTEKERDSACSDQRAAEEAAVQTELEFRGDLLAEKAEVQRLRNVLQSMANQIPGLVFPPPPVKTHQAQIPGIKPPEEGPDGEPKQPGTAD